MSEKDLPSPQDSPLVAATADDSWQDVEHDGAGGGELSASRIKGLRVLIVEDDVARRDSIAGNLRGFGAHVVTGGAGEEGLRRAMEALPDVVLADLTTPGEPGWWLFQRFRRHPLLRWTPVLLMRWWDETPEGRDRLLVSKVVERLGETLAPLGVLEERVAAGRMLADRVEAIGVVALLKVLAGARLTGKLVLNDSWNVFEVRLQEGRPVAVGRRGVEGEEDFGRTAFFQLLLSEAGRWTFRSQDSAPRPENLVGDLRENLDLVGGVLARLLGPDAELGEGLLHQLTARHSLVRDVASSLDGLGRQITEGIAAGASAPEIETLLTTGEEIAIAERTLIGLLRCGALQPVFESDGGARDETERRIVRSVNHVLERIAAEQLRPAPPRADDDTDPGQSEEGSADEAKPGGYYQVSQVKAERVAARAREAMSVPGARFPSITAPIGPDAPGLVGRSTPVVGPDMVAFSATDRAADPFDEGHVPPPRVVPRDSIAPGQLTPEDRGRRQMWLAISLAVLLAGLLVIGLVVVGTSGREPPAPRPGAGAGR